MTRPLIVMFICLALVSRVAAQPGYGVEAGLGMSTMRFAPALGFTSASTSPNFSGKIGCIADLKMNRKLYFQSGLFISQKGQTRDFSFYESSHLNESVHQTLTISYLELPVNVVYKTRSQGKGRAFLSVGVTPAYIIGGRNKFQADGVTNDTPFHTVVNTRISNGNPVAMFDIGINLSGGYELPTGLVFRIYFTSGVQDIGLGTEIDKNRVWGVSAGYLFGKGRNINKEAADLIDHSTD